MNHCAGCVIATGLLALASSAAFAAVDASLDRNQIAPGDTVTLTIATDDPDAKPDLTPLDRDFTLSDASLQVAMQQSGAATTIARRWTVELVPKHGGVIEIPALAVGAERTPPLRLAVSAQAADTVPGPGAAVFIESAITPENPYVSQLATYTVRMYFAIELLGGNLDAPPPDGIDLRQIDNGTRDSVERDGHRYNVIERHYMLRPTRSGVLHVPAPVFRGRAQGDMPFAAAVVDVQGKPTDLVVRPRPAQAADPWLPARSIALIIDPPNTPLRAGEPFTLTVTLSGQGVVADQLPEVALPPIDGAQVYPEPSSTGERLRDGIVQAERIRRFAVVPERAGTLRMPDLTLPWWDVGADRAALARAALPPLQVQPGAPTTSMRAPSADAGVAPAQVTDSGPLRAWKIATGVLAALLLAALWWGWRRGHRAVDGPDDRSDAGGGAIQRGPGLARALAAGDASVIAQALQDAAPSPARHLGDVARQLQDPAQRAAVRAFDAARWSAGGADGADTLAALREAFRRPPQWMRAAPRGGNADALPPLYPD